MSLYENWISKAYDEEGQSQKKYWDDYMPLEQKVYESLLANHVTTITGTPKTLAIKYNMSIEYICGFLDGINDATGNTLNIKELEDEQVLTLEIDHEKLFKKMVEYKAEHLYTLTEWNTIFTPERQKEMYFEQKKSGTVVKEAKPSRNDRCPCGSGKKYKKCCALV